MSDLVLEVQKREKTGKNVNRQLRASGSVPAVVYGGADLDPAVIKVETRKIQDLLRKSADDNPVFLLKLAGTDQKRHCMIREMHTDAITGQVLHIDFQRVDMNKEVQVAVRIELQGTAVGVKTDGGLLDFVTREVEIWSMPDSIPGQIDLNVESLQVGQHVEAGQLELPEGVRLAGSEDIVILSIHGKAVSEDDEDEEGEEAEEVV